MKLKRLISAGCVVYKKSPGALKVALIARRNKKVWCIPKGKIEKGESIERAAEREVKEETGLEGKIEKKLGEITYSFTQEGVGYFKCVHFYLMRYVKGSTDDHDDEADEARWFDIGDAIKAMTYPSERSIMRKAKSIFKKNDRQ